MRERKIKIGRIYRHYKGHNYKVIGIARYSEDDNKEFVIYEQLYDSPAYKRGQLWVRPKEMFLERITRDGKTFYRFEEVISE